MRLSRCRPDEWMSLQVVVLLLVDVAEQALEQHFGEADDGVERRAQLVRHVGEELRLVLVRDLELPALVLDLAEQARVLDGDDGLVRERLQQRDVLVGERPGVVAADADRADAPCPPTASARTTIDFDAHRRERCRGSARAPMASSSASGKCSDVPGR